MDAEKKLEEEEYALGVNIGYVMNKYSPEIAELLVQPKSNSPRLKGFKSGMEQYEKEVNSEKYPNWLIKDELEQEAESPERSKDIDPDRE